MAYPGNKTHRRNRRRLMPGQGPFPASCTATVAPAGSTAILTFSRPVNVNGNISATVATRTFVSQSIDSPTQVTITYSGSVATHAFALPSNDPALSTREGGAVLGVSATFP